MAWNPAGGVREDDGDQHDGDGDDGDARGPDAPEHDADGPHAPERDEDGPNAPAAPAHDAAPGHDADGRDAPEHDADGPHAPERDEDGPNAPAHDAAPGHDADGRDAPEHDADGPHAPERDEDGPNAPAHDAAPGHDADGRDAPGLGGPKVEMIYVEDSQPFDPMDLEDSQPLDWFEASQIPDVLNETPELANPEPSSTPGSASKPEHASDSSSAAMSDGERLNLHLKSAANPDEPEGKKVYRERILAKMQLIRRGVQLVFVLAVFDFCWAFLGKGIQYYRTATLQFTNSTTPSSACASACLLQ